MPVKSFVTLLALACVCRVGLAQETVITIGGGNCAQRHVEYDARAAEYSRERARIRDDIARGSPATGGASFTSAQIALLNARMRELDGLLKSVSDVMAQDRCDGAAPAPSTAVPAPPAAGNGDILNSLLPNRPPPSAAEVYLSEFCSLSGAELEGKFADFERHWHITGENYKNITELRESLASLGEAHFKIDPGGATAFVSLGDLALWDKVIKTTAFAAGRVPEIGLGLGFFVGRLGRLVKEYETGKRLPLGEARTAVNDWMTKCIEALEATKSTLLIESKRRDDALIQMDRVRDQLFCNKSISIATREDLLQRIVFKKAWLGFN